MNFSFSNSTRIEFGQGRIAKLASLIDADQKVLVVYGGGSIKKNGVYDQIKEALKDHSWLEFSGVEANPTVETLDKAVELARKEKVNYILAVGGGSVIDGCKYIAAATLYDGDGWDILTRKYTIARALPLGVVLTLPATGSESNGGSVVTKAATKEKLSFGSPLVLPRVAVLDPDVIKSLPERQVANGVVDAFVHICEQYLSHNSDAWVQDGYAEALLRNLVRLAEEFPQRDNDVWRNNLMWTANQALNGLIGAGVAQDWATHMIGHEITALYGVDHARTLAIVQPSLLRVQIAEKRAKLEQMGRTVFNLPQDENLAETTIEAIERLYSSLDIPTRLSHAGIEGETAVPALVDALEKHGMTALGENRAITIDVSREILQRAA
ncbi:iron-containing alcohol dehydrogenase [Hahella sp. KA22]|uniref:iron-containing alcohol dehydrogenase n=1 Tax=Hahella sp. KA22 TaxID=1628392 RepID=UPI000FDD82FE|nr:iron-containing alcohol dehydrogenase [Hahella sp. KA22]AZZ92156.1 iron-containing alcohol dehydrogenase [Hahella sp. KA22]QAY55527.1 iron-containing alcohol dehydrogenase [Hahella sp. KA22]